MKKNLSVFLILCLILISCGNKVQTDNEAYKSDISSTVLLEENSGTYITTMNETSHYGDFLTNEQVKNILTAPKLDVDGTEICIIKEFGEEALTGNVSDFQNYNAAPTDLMDIKYAEICNEYSLESSRDQIPLEGTEGVRLRPVAVNYDKDSGKISFIHRILDNGQLTYQLWCFSSTGELISNEMLGLPLSEYRMFGIYLTDTAVYYMPDNGKNSYHRTLYRYDIASGEITEAAEDIRLAVKQETMIYCIGSSTEEAYNSGTALFSLNTETGEKHEIISVEWPTGEDISDMAYDSINEIVYYGGISTVYAYSHHSEEMIEILQGVDETAAVIGMYGSNVLIRVGNNMIAAYESTGEMISIDEVRVPIRICTINSSASAEEMFSKALDLCRMNGYDFRAVDVLQISSPEEYSETMAKKIMAGDNDFDIFMVDSESQFLLERKYFEDLSQYSNLNFYFEKMLPGVRGLCSIDDDLCLIPQTLLGSAAIWPALPDFNGKDLIELSDIEGILQNSENKVQIPMDWSDMAAAGYELFAEMISNYMNYTVDNETFEQDLCTLYRVLLLWSEKQEALPINDSANIVKFVDNYYPGKIDDSECLISLLPKITDTYKNSVSGVYYAINPNSPDKKNAAILLSAMLQCDSNSSFGYYFEDFPGENKIYRSILENSVREWNVPDLQKHLEEQFSLIASGLQNEEDAAANTFHYIKMIRDE